MPKIRISKWDASIVGLLLGIVLIFVILYLRGQGSATRDIEAIHKLGFPVTHDEFHALAPQAGEDAAPDYDRYISLVGGMKAPQYDAFRSLTKPNPSGAPAMQLKEAQSLKPILELLMEGAKKPRWIRRADLNTRRRDLREVYTHGVPLLCNVATIYAVTGKLDEALRYLNAARDLSTQGDHDSGGFSFVSGHALLDGYSHVIKSARNNTAVLTSLHAQVASMPLRNNHLLLTLYFIDDVDKVSGQPTLQEDEATLPNQNPAISRAVAADISLWRKAFERLAKDPKLWDDPEAMFRDIYRKYAKDSVLKSMGSNFQMCADSLVFSRAQVARQRVALAAITLLLERQKTGSFPTTLPNMGQNSIDLFTGKPLIYRLKGKGFVLYSVGPNMLDDGGRDWAPAIGNAYDVAFEI